MRVLWDDAPPPGIRLRVRLAAGAAEPGPGGTEPRRRGQTRPAGREAYEAFMSRLTSLRAP